MNWYELKRNFFFFVQVFGVLEVFIRDLLVFVIGGDFVNFDVFGFVNENKGKLIVVIVEQVRDGSIVRVYFFFEFQYVQVFVVGIQVG